MKQKKRNIYQHNNLPKWNLNDLYKSKNCKELKKDLLNLDKDCKLFEKKYFQKIEKLKAKELFKAILKIEKIDTKMDKILSYAHLLVAENGNNEKNKIFFQQMQEKITSYASSIIFFGLELNSISERNLKKLLKSNELKKYKNWIINKRSFKPHQLDLKIEKLLQDKNITSYNSWVRLFDDTIASLKFSYKNKKLTSSEIFNLLTDKKETTRKVAAKSVGNTLGKNIKLFSTITNTLAKDKSINDKWRKLSNPVSSRNLANVVQDEVVDSLANSVIEFYPKISHRYYSLKAEWFGKKYLNYWDRNAPLPFQSLKRYSWLEAKEIVLNAYSDFDQEIGKIAKKFFDNSWIHAPVSEGKSPGAFAASTVAEVHPFILVNYLGKARDVSTLAHELGHGIHQCLAAEQGEILSSTPLTLAETASVFGEMLTFNKLLSKCKGKKERKHLLASKVEDMINTVIRQISFYDFECRLHKARDKGELTPDEINNIWLSVSHESLGDCFSFFEGYETFWSYVPHFIHSPFYVYAYAFGDGLVNALYSRFEAKLPGFEEKYLAMLSSGGSKHHSELLKPFGLDASDPTFWSGGLDVISTLIDKLEALE